MKTNVAIISGLTALALIVSPAFAEQKEESGSVDLTYVKRDVQTIAEGHTLMLADATGTNQGGGRLDGFSVSAQEIGDINNGNGSNSGYAIFSKGNDEQTAKFNGKIATEMKDGHPNTTVSGNWQVVAAKGTVAGSRGEGTYTGYFTAADKYHIDWKGKFEGPVAKASRK
jgi:hypothetical protein